MILRTLALAALALIPSCTSYTSAPLAPRATAQEFSNRSLEDPGLQKFLASQNATGPSWTLDRLALVAVYYHPDIALARAEADEAAAAVTTAARRPNPVFSFSPKFASNRVTSSAWILPFATSIPIETSGKRSIRTAQALSLVEAARWRVSAQAWTSRSQIRAAMLDLYAARENARLLEAEQTYHQEALTRLSAQREAGDISSLEITQIKLAINRSLLARQDAHRNMATAQTRLASHVGIPLSALSSATLDFSSFANLPDPGTHSGQRKALTRRADLMALLADYAAAEASLRLEIAKQYPDLNLSPGYDYNQDQNRWQLGLSFELPLNRNHGAITQAEAKRKTASARFLAKQNTIREELDTALASYRASREKAMTAMRLVQTAEEVKRLTQGRVDAGESSALEVTMRDLEISTARLTKLSSDIEAQAAAGALENAMQFLLQ